MLEVVHFQLRDSLYVLPMLRDVRLVGVERHVEPRVRGKGVDDHLAYVLWVRVDPVKNQYWNAWGIISAGSTFGGCDDPESMSDMVPPVSNLLPVNSFEIEIGWQTFYDIKSACAIKYIGRRL